MYSYNNINIPLAVYVKVDYYQFEILKNLYKITKELYKLKNWKLCYRFGSMFIKQYSVLLAEFHKYNRQDDISCSEKYEYTMQYLNRDYLKYILELQSKCSKKTCSPFILKEITKINKFLYEPIHIEPNGNNISSNFLLYQLFNLLENYNNLQNQLNIISHDNKNKLDKRIFIINNILQNLDNKFDIKINNFNKYISI